MDLPDSPDILKDRLEVREYEFNEMLVSMLGYFKRSNWKYLRDNHPDIFAFVKSQIQQVDNEKADE